MDNLTHTAIGLVVGDAAHHLTNPREMPSVERRRLFILASALGSNIPDIDVWAKHFALPGPLGPLLLHRGYTHTLIWALPEALAVIAGLLLLRGSILSKRLGFSDWVLALLTALVAVALHIFADSWNSYGVHPFYPLDNGWFYGDFIFIIEPLLWTIMGAWILLELPLAWRLLYFSLFAAVVGFGFHLGVIGSSHVIVLLALVTAITLLMGLGAPSRRSGVALVMLALLLSGFYFQSRQARALVAEVYRASSLGKPEDIALSPLPMNPFCWTALAASTENGDFIVRRAAVTLWPGLWSPDQCRLLEPKTSAVSRVAGGPRLTWLREYRTPLARFKFYAGDCFLRDWLKFARLPQIEGNRAFDARFDNGRGRNFTELVLQTPRACEADVPDWGAPRENLTAVLK
jgi:inner membrane protein